jgi:peptidoglycan/xylan/chitin deacetylase (PgdA/CDA1 family)
MQMDRGSVGAVWRRLACRRAGRYGVAALAGAVAFALGWRAHGAPAARVIRAVPVQEKAVALTFDDGPNPTYTPRVLKLLEDNGAKATFFVVGREVARHPDLVRAEAAAGHEVANHGDQHRTLKGLDASAVEAEVAANEQLITDLTGTRPVLYRLPQGRMDPGSLAVLARLGYTVVMWSVDTRDYQRRTPQAIADQVLREVRPGSIVIFHDGGGNRQATVDALGVILPRLRAEGYRMATVSQLLELARAGQGDAGDRGGAAR